MVVLTNINAKKKIMKNGPGLEPETSGTMYHDSSNWAIQPSDGGFHKKK